MEFSLDIINNKKYLVAISKLFTPLVMNSLVLTGQSKYLTEVFENSGLMNEIDMSISLSDFFDQIYKFMFRYYRSEYIYKNVITNKILLGKHSLNTSHMLSEFRVDKCKADVVIVNGTSTVYEIKSEYDSFKRLENQIRSYLKVFDLINVVTSKNQAGKLEFLLPKQVGILVLTNRNTISTIREAKSNIININSDTVFDSLRKHEYIKIIKEYFGDIPSVPNTQVYKVCKKLFRSIPIVDLHNLTVKTLFKRGNQNALSDFLEKAPLSLSAYAVTICDQEDKMEILTQQFNRSIGSVLQ